MRQSIVIACGFFPLPVKTRGALLRSNKSQGVGIRVMDCILLCVRPEERGRRIPHPAAYGLNCRPEVERCPRLPWVPGVVK